MDELMHFTVWMNNTPEPRTLTHPMQTSDWRDGLTEEPVAPAGGVMNVSLDPYGFRILYRRLK
ncbi:hypothetical protein HMSSN036_16170 [Paenibacillus macerans]|nr:hypothetical protein HMSSN036_16170 [Paenibacillus macerans]